MNDSHFDHLNRSFHFEKSDYGLFHQETGIKFIEVKTREALPSVLKVITAFSLSSCVGIYCESLTEKDKDKLKKNEISYIAGAEEIKIFRPSPKNELSHHNSLDPISTLISPTGLEIADTILKSSKSELGQINPTEFCHKYELSRSKMSHIMNAYSSREMSDLAEKLKKISLEEWLHAMDKSITSRSMTAFRTKKSKVYIFDDEIDDFDLFNLFDQLKRKSVQLEYGGLSYLKIEGRIKARDFDLVVRDKDIGKILNTFKLRPPRKDDSFKKRLIVTPCGEDIYRERFASKIPNGDGWNFQLDRLNVLRFVWGIREKESRIQEERLSLLRKYLRDAEEGYLGRTRTGGNSGGG